MTMRYKHTYPTKLVPPLEQDAKPQEEFWNCFIFIRAAKRLSVVRLTDTRCVEKQLLRACK